MKQITLENLPDFIRGTAILGTGGGGDPYVGRLMLQQELEKCGSINIIDPDDVTDDTLAVSVACMGAPTVFVEKLPNANSAIEGLRISEREIAKSFNAIIPLEAGGINATLPLVVAARLGLPVIDGDGMGRAFPEFQMTTFNVYGVDSSPFVITDDGNNSIIIRADTALRAERYGRPVCVQMGGIAQVASYAMTGEEIRRSCVPGTVSLAVEIGRTVRETRIAGETDVCTGLVNYFEHSNPPRFSRILFDGKVQDVLRETKDGWTIGEVSLLSETGADEMKISFQNEYSYAMRNGQLAAIVPDLIVVLDRETGEAITTEGLRYGQRVKVLGIAAPPVMRSEAALPIIGPSAFRIKEPFVPLEDLAWRDNANSA
ncbi:DUF917 domain-containing protein [Shimia sediminis]|uniref:DUF917 domain-containing protein n=1 Tax=Shimia sediminis TaxID=2497945 RepID=UPI0019815279|nr:DUF917 domain-containing protein [Shimia sediminis]